MRLLLGALVLAALFLAATLWQRRWTSAARAERNEALGSTIAAPRDLADGWSRVIVGRPSGSEPYSSPPRPDAAEAAADAGKGPKPAPPLPAPVPDSRPSVVIVQAGQSLSGICSERYGTARPEVVDAVAHHNRLVNPDSLREGQELELPPLEKLLPRH